MRDILTGFAIILIVVLTTILVAPYFVDWSGQRSFLEARLSHALGQKVTIGGSIDLKLLPTPYLVLDQVVVGGDEAPITIGIHHLDLELTVAPLLHGEFDIVEARLVEPTIRVNLEHDRTLPALPPAPAFQADVRFDRIQVSDGTLAIADPLSGRTFVFDHLELDADAGSLAGPFKVSGVEGAQGERTKFRFASTAAEKGRARVRLLVEETPAHAALELDGAVDLAAAGGDTLRQSFDGTLAVSGHVSQVADAPIAWKISGPLKADPHQATLDGGELRLGDEDAGVTLQAKAKAQLDETPRLALDLTAKQLDFDRLSGAPVDTVRPPPPKLPDLDKLRRLLAAAATPIPTALDIQIDNATYGGETLSDLQAHLGLGDTAQPLKISGDGPGGSHLMLDGRLGMAPAASFAGRMDIEADNLPRAVDWLGSVAPSLPWKGRDLSFRTVKVAGNVEVSSDALSGDTLSITLDRSILTGTARLAFGDASTSAKMTADLGAEALDLDNLPGLDILRGGAGLVDFDLRLDAKAIKVVRVGEGALDTGHIRLAISKMGQHVEVQDFRAEDLGGATIQAVGSLDPRESKLAMTLDAARLDAAATLVRQLAPGPFADILVTRAAVLAPAKLKIDAALEPRADGTIAPTRLSIVGALGETRIDATAKPDATQAGLTVIAAALTAPDGSVLLSQLGVPALPMALIGSSRITLAAHGHAGDPFDTSLAVVLGATTLDANGRFDILSAVPTGTGTLRLHSPDLTPLLQSLAIAFPDMTGSVSAEATGALALDANGMTLSDLKADAGGLKVQGTVRYRHGTADKPALTGSLELDRLALSSLLGLALGPPQSTAAGGIWSKQPFAVGLIDPPQGAFSLKVKTLEIVPGVDATNTALDLGIAPNLVTLDNIKADLAGGRIGSDVTLRRDGRQATTEGKIALDGVGLRIAALDARVTATLDIAGGGTSSLALMSSLAGSGDATAVDLNIPDGDPSALPRIFQDVENDILAVDQDAVIRAFEDVATDPLRAGTRHFGLGLAAGTLHADPKDAEPLGDSAVSSAIDTDFDLTQSHIDEHVVQTLRALPKNWEGPAPSVAITLSGPLDRPARSIDVSGFLNAVAARALARETARIEIYEFDIRERALFNARLQSERRREEERQTADDNARKAEAERREAARQDRLRKEKAAKAAQEKIEQEKAEQEQVARDRAARDEAERAARARNSNGPAPHVTAPGDQPPQPPADTRDAPPAGTDPSTLGRY